MDLFAAGVLTKLTAGLTAKLLNAAGRRTRVALNGDDNYQALQRCVEAGVVALLSMAGGATPDERQVLDSILRAFFDDDDVLGELSEALRGHPLDTDELTYLFGQAGYDAETLPGWTFSKPCAPLRSPFSLPLPKNRPSKTSSRPGTWRGWCGRATSCS